MCHRSTYKLTWEELVQLFRLTADQPARNTRARYNVCPTDPVDTVIEPDGKHELATTGWGLVPFWWSKTIKDIKLATFNARAETVTERPLFRDAFKQRRFLLPMSGYYASGRPRRTASNRGISPPAMVHRHTDGSGALGPMARQGQRRDDHLMHHDHHRAEYVRCRGARSHAGVACRERFRAVAERSCRRRTFQTCRRRFVATLAGVEAGQ